MNRSGLAAAICIAGLLGCATGGPDGSRGSGAVGVDDRTPTPDLVRRAEEGNASAQYQLGERSRGGKGLPQDSAAAAHWFLRAAEQGHAGAQFSLGAAYCFGEGIPKEPCLGSRWIRLAAEQGHTGAMRLLAANYRDGIGVSRDLARSYQWLCLAIVLDDKAHDRERTLSDSQAGVYAGLTTEQVSAAHARAREWRPMSQVAVAAAIKALRESGSPRRPAAGIRRRPASVSDLARPPAELMADWIAIIRDRLVGFSEDCPELCGIENAVLSPASLEFTRGSVTWPDGEGGTPLFADPDSCQLRIALAHPSPPAHRANALAKRRIIRQVHLTVDVIFVCAGQDVERLQRALDPIVDEELVWLVLGMDLAKLRPPPGHPVRAPGP